jgi:hypothetical protein
MLSRRQWLKWSETPNKSRSLNWLENGGLIFLFTWLIWLVVSDTALAADPSGAETLGGESGGACRVCLDNNKCLLCLSGGLGGCGY